MSEKMLQEESGADPYEAFMAAPWNAAVEQFMKWRGDAEAQRQTDKLTSSSALETSGIHANVDGVAILELAEPSAPIDDGPSSVSIDAEASALLPSHGMQAVADLADQNTTDTVKE